MQRKNNKLTRYTSLLWRAIGSNWLWLVVVTLFVMQAAYLALVGRFSMAFDEYYHYGLIQEYAKYWLPWSIQQPPGPAEIGAITADGSYLYHYLMSFPYRLLQGFVNDVETRLIILRLIDVGIFTAGLYAYRKVLRLLGASTSVAQAILFIVMLIPVSAWLAGQLTYDVLWFTLTGYTLWVLVQFIQRTEARGHLSLRHLALVLSLLLLGAQVKYASLPFLLAAVVFLLAWIVQLYRSKKLDIQSTLSVWKKDIRTIGTIATLALLLASSVFFMARYGSNIVKYHHPVPSCDVVVSVERCVAYGPFGRNERYKVIDYQAYLTMSDRLTYPLAWYGQMVWETYFAVGPREVGYKVRDPLPLPYRAGYVLIIATTVLILLGARRLWADGSATRLLLLLSLTYVGFLFFKNITDYFALGVPVAIHGRYVLALVPIFGWLAYRVLRSYSWFSQLRTPIGIGFGFLFLATLYGSGITTYIVRADLDWYWTWAQPTADAVQQVLRRVLLLH